MQAKCQAVIDTIERWTAEHGLRIAPEKCAYVTLKGEFVQWAGLSLKLGTVNVKQKREATLLGLNISPDRSWVPHVESRVRRNCALRDAAAYV